MSRADIISDKVLSILSAAEQARGEWTGPTFTIWNAFVLYIPMEDRIAAAERYADTISPEWRLYI